MSTHWMSAAALAALLWLGQEPAARPQEPDRPAPPPSGAAPLPAVGQPWVARVARLDLAGRTTPPDVLEGFWELRQRSVGGEIVPTGEGHMAIGRRHLVVNFSAPGPDPEVPLLRAGSYAWERIDEHDAVRMTVLVGHYNDEDGDVMIEPPGTIELRHFETTGSALRVMVTEGDWLEFVRIE